MGAIYFGFMMFGASWCACRRRAGGPRDTSPARGEAAGRAGAAGGRGIRTPQFWLLWAVLFLNVTAGIGVLGQASPMIQEMFPGRSTGRPRTAVRRPAEPVQHGRPVRWSSLSDFDGPQVDLRDLLLARGSPYALTPQTGRPGAGAVRAGHGLIMCMYGGGFATIPAYLRDLFGTAQVGAIHGRLLTAWSLAAVLGAAAGQLRPRVPDQPRRAAGRGVHGHDVRHGRAAGRRPRVQPARRHSRSREVPPFEGGLPGAKGGECLRHDPPGKQDIDSENRHLLDHRAAPLGWGVYRALSNHCLCSRHRLT